MTSTSPETNPNCELLLYCFNPKCSNSLNASEARYCTQCGSRLRLSDRYEFLELLGRGAFGRTFLARDRQAGADERCVIKQIYPKGDRSHESEQERFAKEAETLAKLGQHSRIPKLYDSFQKQGYYYLIQEFIQGENLEQIIARDGVFSEEKIRELLAQLLPVLYYIHSEQVIHRDIKPANIIRGQDDRFWLVDFGSLKAIDASAAQRTATLLGSPEYMAPEQLRGETFFVSDLYSLGTTCLYLLTGVSPFDLFSISDNDWVWRSFCSQATPPSAPFARLLDRLVKLTPRDRIASVADVWLALNPSLTLSLKPEGDRALAEWELTAAWQKEVLEESEAPEALEEPPLVSQQGIDYEPLQNLLANQDWQSANQLTETLLLRAARQERRGWLEADDVKALPCDDLRIPDRLWQEHSQGHFGFLVQQEVWQATGARSYTRFGEAVGWFDRGRWLQPDRIQFDLDAPRGHLPALSWWFGGNIWGLRTFFSCCDRCRETVAQKQTLAAIATHEVTGEDRTSSLH